MTTATDDRLTALETTVVGYAKTVNKVLRKLEASEATLEQVQLDLDKLRVEVGDGE